MYHKNKLLFLGISARIDGDYNTSRDADGVHNHDEKTTDHQDIFGNMSSDQNVVNNNDNNDENYTKNTTITIMTAIIAMVILKILITDTMNPITKMENWLLQRLSMLKVSTELADVAYWSYAFSSIKNVLIQLSTKLDEDVYDINMMLFLRMYY